MFTIWKIIITRIASGITYRFSLPIP